MHNVGWADIKKLIDKGEIMFTAVDYKRTEKVIMDYLNKKKWFLSQKPKPLTPSTPKRTVEEVKPKEAERTAAPKVSSENTSKDAESIENDFDSDSEVDQFKTVSKNPWKEAEMEEKRRQEEIAERKRRESEARRMEEEQKRLVEEEQRRREQKEREDRIVLHGVIRLQALYRRRVARTAFRVKSTDQEVRCHCRSC